jgi:adenylate cyclase
MAETGGGERGTAAQAAPDALRATSGTPDVFISYASQDGAMADAVVRALERARLKCWIAPRDVVPGALYADEIVRAINEAQVVVLILSEAAAASPHVGKEIERASSKRRRIVTLRTDAAALPRAFEYFLSESQWIDVGSGGTEAAAAKLVDAVRRHLAPPSAAQPNVSLAPRIPDRKAAPRRRWVLLVSATVIAVALAYFVVDRFWLSKHVRAAQQTTVATTVLNDRTIAVLPFTDMSEKHDQEYFADGMAEEIVNLLVKIPELKVIGRTSSFQFKRKTDDLRKIGMTLDTAYVVEGSVRKAGDRVRVTAQLIDTRDGTHRWSETYDRSTTDLLKMQDEIAVGLVRALQLEVASSAFGQGRSSPPIAEAYDSYLRGLHARDRFDQRGLEAALASFRRALELQPSFAPAAEAVASTLYYMAEWTYLPPESGFNQARVAAEAALRLDPKSSIAHAVICIVNTEFDWDWSAAAHECSIAIQITPNGPFVLQAAALQHMALGEWKDAAYSIEAALANDPLDPVLHNIAGFIYIRAGRIPDAEAALRRALRISPTAAWNHLLLGTALLMEGRATEALMEMQQETGPGGQALGLAAAYHALHRYADADAALARLKAENAGDSAYFVSEAYAARGQGDQAFSWLERAFAQKDDSLYSLKGDPLLRNLESDPRYKAFLRKMNLPE